MIAASQQTLFIVSGSPSTAILGGGDQNTMLGIDRCGVVAASQPTNYIISGILDGQWLWNDNIPLSKYSLFNYPKFKYS